MRSGKSEYTSAAIERGAVHIWTTTKTTVIASILMIELCWAVRQGSVGEIIVQTRQPSPSG